MQYDLPGFRLEPATRVVSLGGRCATSYNIKRFFGAEDEYPFDYWGTEPRSVASLIQHADIAALYDLDELFLTPGRVAVKHRKLGIQLHHDFPREVGPFIIEPVIKEFRDNIDYARHQTQTRFHHLFQLDRSNERILFVRENNLGHELEMALRTRFIRAAWCLVSVFGGPEDPVHGWRGDPKLWDAALAGLGMNVRASRPAARASAPEPAAA